MSKRDDYRIQLKTLTDWEEFLLQNSGLPGPRANLELAQAVADEGAEADFIRWLLLDPQQAPTTSPQVFLVCCAVIGLGRLLAEGRREWLTTVRRSASDPHWRVREAVAMALQRWGDRDMAALLMAMDEWRQGTLFEMRAVAAAICEPRLLKEPEQVRWVLRILDHITDALSQSEDRHSDEFKTLRQGLGYCWSVAVAALPAVGKPFMEAWLINSDPDIRWLMRENLQKKRLERMNAAWVKRWKP